MPDLTLYTYQDVIDQVMDYGGADPGEEARRYARRAAREALREFASAHRWSYYYQRGRITTDDDYSTGTITYDHTGGSNEREVTLASGTWPSWAAFGVLVISNVPYEIYQRVSSTVLTLKADSNPGADVAAGTSYTLYRDTYPLPVDFQAMDELINQTNGAYMSYAHPRDWISMQRGASQTVGLPSQYSITSDPNYFGRMAIRLWRPPDDDYPLDFVYQRRPRQLKLDSYSTGTVTTTASTTVNGTSTAFASAHAGAVLRVSSDTLNVPTSVEGLYPAAEERVILSVTSATVLVVDTAFTQSLSAVKYRISDPLDVEEGVMLNAYLRCAEMHYAIMRNTKTKADAVAAYQDALVKAKEADSRAFMRRSPGGVGVRGLPYKNMPITLTD